MDFSEVDIKALRSDMKKFMDRNRGTVVILSKDKEIDDMMSSHGTIPVLLLMRSMTTSQPLKDRFDNMIQDNWLKLDEQDRDKSIEIPTTEIIDSWQKQLTEKI